MEWTAIVILQCSMKSSHFGKSLHYLCLVFRCCLPSSTNSLSSCQHDSAASLQTPELIIDRSEHFPDVFTSSASVSLQSLLFCFLFISALVESCTFINKQLEYFSKYKCVHKLKVCEKGKGWTVRDVRWSQRWSRKSLSF